MPSWRSHLVIIVALLAAASGGAVLLWWQAGGSLPAFERAQALWGALVLLPMWGMGLYWQPRRRARLSTSRGRALGSLPVGRVQRLRHLPLALRLAASLLFVGALARPQTLASVSVDEEGMDIMFVLDLSQSMELEDLPRSRLDAGQRTIRSFMRDLGGAGDRLALVVFAQEAMVLSPLTRDHASFDAVVSSLSIGDVPPLGTAIGDALGLALTSLERSDSKAKLVILLSDGDWNRARFMDPNEAGQLAVDLGVRVFSVLLGGGEESAAPNDDSLLLRELARRTGGRFFAAGSERELYESFADIRKGMSLERRRHQARIVDRELYPWLVWPGFVLLLCELVLRRTRWRTAP